MRLLQRLKFALKYDFIDDFVVYSIPDQMTVRFTNYEDARAFSDKQIQYRPKVLIGVEKL